MKLKWLFTGILLLTLGAHHAQNNAQTDTLKVGLVLSGGGAKGLAHIGVLKIIDSLGIKVDYVAGTSMGAIIGSLYASGYSGKQLEAIFKAQDFDQLINDEFPRESKSFYERKNDHKYAISLPFDNLKVQLPSALSRGQNVYNLMSQLLLHVNTTTHFSQLPIPFFCMATNIETGESLTLEKGNLVDAVTASAALPSLYQPVTIGNTILMDGGITNNYPVETLIEKGMTRIIGVDVQDRLKKRDQLNTVIDYMLQISNFRTINDMASKIPLTTIYIKPDISNFSVISFDKGDKIIKSGQKAALQVIKPLKNLKQQQNTTIEKPTIHIPDSLIINNISIANNNNYTRSYVLGKLKFRPKQTITFKTLQKGIERLMATNNFDKFKYTLSPVENSNSFDFLAKVEESKSKTSLGLGLHYDDLYESAALLSLSKKRMLFDNDFVALDVGLGNNSRYNFQYFIDKGYYLSIGVNSRYNQFDNPVSADLVLDENSSLTQGINKLGVTLQDLTNQIYFQTIFRNDFAMRFGAEHKFLKIKSETIFQNNRNEPLILENSDYYSAFGEITFDSFDNALFPKSGFYFKGDFHLYLFSTGFNQGFNEFSIAKAKAAYAFSMSDKLAFKLQASGGFKIGDKSTNSLSFGFGGYANNLINNYQSFYGYDFLSFFGDSFVKSSLLMDYELFNNHHILLGANFANAQDGLFETTNWINGIEYSGYMAGYSLETFLGPLEAKVTYSPEIKQTYWFFNLGYWF